MAIGNLKINVDTAGAQRSINGFAKSWTEANQATELAGKVIGFFIDRASDMMKVLHDSGNFFSQYGALGQSAASKLDLLRRASDDMISSTQIMASANILTKNGLNLSAEAMENAAKAAVELGRQTGKSTDSMFQMLTDALASGRLSQLKKFGFDLKTTGTEAEKQQAVIDLLAKKYGNLTIAAGDTAEVQAKLANALKVNTMFNVKDKDALGQMIERLKGGFKEVTNNVILGELGIKTWLKKLQELSDASARYNIDVRMGLEKRQQMQLTLNDLERSGNLTLGEKQSRVEALLKQQQDLVRSINDAATNERVMLMNLEKGTSEYALHEKKLLNLNSRLGDQKIILKEIGQLQKDLSAEWQMAAANLRNTLFAALDRFNKGRKDAEERRKREIEEGKRAYAAEQAVKKQYKDQVALLHERVRLMHEANIPMTIAQEEEIKRIYRLIEMNKLQREAFLLTENATKANKEAAAQELQKQKEIGEASSAAAALGLSVMKQAHEVTIKEQEALRKTAGMYYDLDVAKQKELLAAEQVNAAGKIGLDIVKQKKLLIEAMITGDNTEVKRIKENITALNNQKMAVTESIAVFKSMSSNIVKGLTMESSELKKLGKSRSQYIMETVAATLKAKGIEYAVKSLGSFAEAAAATFFNPPAAAALAKAGALYAAAAAAAGTAGAALGKTVGGGGNSAATNTSPTASSSAGSTTETKQGPQVFQLVLNKSTIFGNEDEAMRRFNNAFQDAKARGAF